jgi:hypothetical protein
MKNIHVLSTKKPSKLLKDIVDKTYQLKKEVTFGNRIEVPLNIYITEDVKIRTRGWYIDDNEIYCNSIDEIHSLNTNVFKKIILTTDQDLINDRVQPIPDEFLEWFVKNPSCDFVEVVFNNRGIKIIIPKEEPKQETLEEVDQRLFNKVKGGITSISAFKKGAKWQQEQDNNKFSEEEVLPLLEMLQKCKEYFLLKTDAKSEERADTIGQVIEDFNKFKKNKI